MSHCPDQYFRFMRSLSVSLVIIIQFIMKCLVLVSESDRFMVLVHRIYFILNYKKKPSIVMLTNSGTSQTTL